jgi:sialidase-1
MNNNPIISRFLRLCCALALCTSLVRAQEPYIYEAFNFANDGIWQTEHENIRVPNMVISDQGTICVLLQDRDRKSDNADNKIVLKRSFDGGETWSALEVAIDPSLLGFDTITPHSSVFLPANGSKPDRLLILFQDRFGTLGYKTETVSDIDDPDKPLVWTTPVAMPHLKDPASDSVLFGAGEGIVLRHGAYAGRILFTGGQAFAGLPTEMCSYYSDDDGETWSRGNYVPQPTGFQGSSEVSPVELPNGDIMCVLRTGSSAIAKAQMISTDGGINWATPVRNGVQLDNAVNQGILAFSDPADGEISRILFSSPGVYQRNTGSIYLSYDQGANWSARKVIYPDTGDVSFIYSSIIRLPDGNIGVVWPDFVDNNVKFAKFSLDWLTDGADFIGNTTVPQDEAMQLGFESAESADGNFVNAWGNWTEADTLGGVWSATNAQTSALVPHEGAHSASLGNAGDSYLEYDPPGSNGVRSVTFWFRRSSAGDTGNFKLEYNAGAGWQPTSFSVSGEQSNDYDVSGQPFVEINQPGDVKLRWSVTGHVGGRLNFDDLFIVPMDNTGPVNNPPAFASDPIGKADATEGSAYSAALASDATDPDPGDTLTFSKAWGPGWLNVAADGTLSGTPGRDDVGLNTFRVRATDPGAMFNEVTLNITVDSIYTNAMLFSDDFERAAGTMIGSGWIEAVSNSRIFDTVKPATKMVISVDAGQPFAVVNQLADIYEEGAIYEVSWKTSRASKSIGTLNYNVAIGTWDGVSFTLLASEAGNIANLHSSIKLAGPEASFTASAAQAGQQIAIWLETTAGSDNWVGFDDIVVNSWSLLPTNNPPVFLADPINRPDASAGVAYTNTIAGTATDSDSDPLSYSITNGPAWLSIATNGVLTGTPASGNAGTNSWVVQVEDGNGGSDAATLQIYVLNYYDVWGVANGLNAGNSNYLVDADGDGLLNLFEYALGGNPSAGPEAPSITPTGEIVNVGGSNVFEYVYRRRTDAATRGLDYYLELTENLTGSWSTNGYTEISAVPLESGFESVTNHVGADPDSCFIRLKVEINE